MRGLTLIELMIALVITSIILIALTQVFVTTRHSYQTDEGLARLQENARFAVQFLTHDLRMAGNLGCMGEPKQKTSAGEGKIITYLNPPSEAFDTLALTTRNPITMILGFDAVGPVPGVPYALPTIYPPTPVSSTNPPLNAALAPWGAVAGSDVLVLRFQHGNATPIDRAQSNASQIAAMRPHNITDNQVVMVSDCTQAVIFQVTSMVNAGGSDILMHAAAGTPGNQCAVWNSCGSSARQPRSQTCDRDGVDGLFGCGAQVAQFRTVTYFIGAGGSAGSPVPALYRAVFDESGVALAEELVDGVENLQITYGVDTDGDTIVDRYLIAPAVIDWTTVQTIRVGLLLATSYTGGQSEMGADTAPFYDIGGMAQIIVPTDQRRRRVVVETVKIRNRPIH